MHFKPNNFIMGFALLSSLMGLGGYGLYHFWAIDSHEDVVVKLNADFGSGSEFKVLTKRAVYTLQTCCSESTQVAAVPGSTRVARKFEIRNTTRMVAGGYRSELRLRPELIGSERWYQARVFLPADWDGAGDPVIILQWHGTRDAFLGRPGNLPALIITAHGLEWTLSKAWNKKLLGVGEDDVEGQAVLAKGPLSTGEWHTWTLNVCWRPDERGHVRAWHDGKLVADTWGPIGYRNLFGPYLKAGLYMPTWKEKGPERAIYSRTIYFDYVASVSSQDRLPFPVGPSSSNP